MDNNIITQIRASKGFSRSIALLIILALLGLTLERTLYYALNESDIIEDENPLERINRLAPTEARKLGLPKYTKNNVAKTQAEQQKTPQEKFAFTAQAIKEQLAKLDNPYENTRAQSIAKTITQLNQQLQSLNKRIKKQFSETAQHIKDKNLPSLIEQRHSDMVSAYNAKFDVLQSKLKRLDAATSEADKLTSLRDVKAWLSKEQFKREQQKFDPNNMPYNSAKPNPKNTPKLKPQDFAAQGFFNSPKIQLAALGDFTFANLPGASNPAYLAETDEIKLTQTIRDQAQALNYDPLQIYQWVRNNIEWQPTWGSVQNSELTLSAKRGNAMDIASLSIALLRASQIPARYVHGTIEVPEDKFRNWAGGFDSIDAAVNFAASGGIPTAANISGGKTTRVRIEHIWVEAAIDYFPSKGARNKDADNWLPLDASYKQYTYQQGLDVVQIAGTDTTQLAQDVLNSGTVNEAEGWVSGFDPTILQTAQATAQTSLETYITNNMTDPTVGDVIGGRRTIVQNYPVLAASLANKIIATGTRYDQLPSNLQQQVSYRFLQNTSSQTNTPVTFAWASVNNEKVTLSFTPATADDEAALQSLLPEGEITDLSQLPSSISAYLIEVIPELKVNGVVQLTGTPMKLGEGLDFHTNIKHPGRASEINYTYNIPAGSFVSVNTVAGNVSSAKLTNLQSQLTQTQTALESTDPTQAQSLTREDILGDMFYTGTLGYFAQLIGFTQIGALQANTQFYLSAGYGTFGYEPKVSYSFGYPISISAGGVTLDIPLNVVTASNSNNKQEEINYKLQAGIIASALEHATPEQLFNTDPTNPPNAFSAVKGLQLAAAEGQRIYQITQANQATTLPNLNLDAATETEITNAVNAGKEVITHTDLVSVPGYTGAGYIIFDPVSGDGAYKISGGGNGGFIALTIAFLLIIFTPILFASTVAGVAGLAALSLINLFSLTSALDKMLSNNNLSDDQKDKLIIFHSGLSIVGSILAGKQAGFDANTPLMRATLVPIVDAVNALTGVVFVSIDRLFNGL